MPIISIIVPVYNVEKYLPRCIDSILGQTFTDFECILIDDGSLDNCPAICDEYAAKDERIVVIHQKNFGASTARNVGLDRAKGKWITFVDSDDWCDSGMFEYLHAKILENNCEIAVCGMRIVDERNNVKDRTDYLFAESIVSSREGMKLLFLPNGFGGFAWSKLIQAKILSKNNLRFNSQIRRREDLLFYFELLHNIHNIFVTPGIFYNYYMHADSVTHKGESIDDFYKAFNVMLKLADDNEIKKMILEYQARRFIEFYRQYALDGDSILRHGITKDEIKRNFSLFLSDKNNSIKSKILSILTVHIVFYKTARSVWHFFKPQGSI
jgi:glycosyltransferase involved in cell wall biosynthesis